MSWTPLLTGAQAEAVRMVVSSIAVALREYFVRDGLDDPWEALLFSYLAAQGVTDHQLIADEMVDQALERLATTPLPHALHGGVTGIAWLLTHLHTMDDQEDPNEELDRLLLEGLRDGDWDGHHDLVAGLSGIGVYLLERGDDPIVSRCLEHVVERLAATAQPTPDGLAWYTPPRRWELDTTVEDPGRFDLGLAHGTAAVVAVLARIHARGIARKTTAALLSPAVRWLTAQRLDHGSGARVPHWAGEPHEGRLGWCSGALGVAVAMLHAGRVLSQPAWEAHALTLALAEAERPFPDTAVVDPYLCHGTAGAAHLFNRLYQATSRAELGDAARRWVARTLGHQHAARPDTIAGFLAPVITPAGGRSAPVHRTTPRGFLTGVAGVGLALLATTTAVAPGWDRVLHTDLG